MELRRRQVNCAALGQDIGQVLIKMTATYAGDVGRSTGTAGPQTRLELALFLSWMAFTKITTDRSLSQEVARQVTDAMERRLGQQFPSPGGSQETFKVLLQNRYEGYMKATCDESNEGGPAWNMAKYFTACCRYGAGPVDYDGLIPDPEDVEKLGDLVNPEGLQALKSLKAQGSHATYPLGMEMIQVSGLLASYTAGLHKGIDSLIRRHS